MIKILSVLSLAVLTACGGGNEPPTMELPKVVQLSAASVAELPKGFVVGPSVTVANVPVVGPGPTAILPFVVGPVKGPVAIIVPTVVIGPSLVVHPTINYCTDGFVVGPCEKLPSTCQPDSSGFVIGPCTP